MKWQMKGMCISTLNYQLKKKIQEIQVVFPYL